MATLKEARAVLGVQRDELERVYARTDNLIRLSIAGLAGIIAISGILAGLDVHIDLPAAILVASGALSVLVATYLFVSAQTG